MATTERICNLFTVKTSQSILPESLSEIFLGLNENWSNSGKIFLMDCKEFDTSFVTSSSETLNIKNYCLQRKISNILTFRELKVLYTTYEYYTEV